MADRPLNFKGNVVNNLIYKGNTVVHVIETGPHCSNANRTVFYKWVTAPTLSADSGTTSKIITFSNTQKEPVAITYSCTGVLSSSGNITSLSAGSSSTITLNYTGSQGNETITATFKLASDNSVIYTVNTTTTLGTVVSALTPPELLNEGICTVEVANPNNFAVVGHITISTTETDGEYVTISGQGNWGDGTTPSFTWNANESKTFTCTYVSTTDTIDFSIYFSANGYTNSETIAFCFALS